MALASLIDAGADLGELRALLARLPLGHWDLRVETVLRGGIACTKVEVSTDDRAAVRTYPDIVALVEAAKLPERVTARALATFGALATVEGGLHRRRAADVHLHEAGGHDAVVDVVGTAVALELLEVDDVQASPVATGTGTIRTAHGTLPNPPPAVTRLLEGVPVHGRATEVELTTPTGAALLAAMASAYGPLPPMEICATGFGAGAAELPDLPNCTQVVVGTALELERPGGGGPGGGQPVVELQVNVDDVTGEQLAHALASLVDAGAHDAWITPVVMKKGRPGHTVHVLADPSRSDALRELLRSATGSFGVRAHVGERWTSARRMARVEVAGQPVAMKVGPDRAKPEFDDVVRAAQQTGLSVRDVASLAEAAWRDLGET